MTFVRSWHLAHRANGLEIGSRGGFGVRLVISVPGPAAGNVPGFTELAT
jgi:hypothetical protein